MNFKHLIAIVLVALLFFSSCTPYKDVPYFQDLRRDTTLKEKIKNFSSLTIQPGDLLGIHVTSLNHAADAIYNYDLTLTTANTPLGIDRQEQDAVIGYLVDAKGDIEFPTIGKVKVTGLSTSEISLLLETKLSEFLTNPLVNVRIKNFKISVLGDVLHPGNFGSLNEKITVTEAIAMAGDLNTTGIRNILLIRETDGNREFIPLDLTSKKLFDSPYYYLKNNDVIYVQPNKARVSAADSGYQRASLIISALSVLAIFLTKI